MADRNYVPPNTKPVDSLTPDQAYRETTHVKELASIQFDALTKAIEVAHEDMVRVPTEVQKAVANLKELVFQKIESREELNQERFSNLCKTLDKMEEIRKEQKKDTQIAMDFALSAVKEAAAKLNEANTTAINKSENAIAEQIKQIMVQIKTETHALDEKITDVKDKVTKYEGSGEGKRENRTATYAIIGLIVMLLTFIINYMMK